MTRSSEVDESSQMHSTLSTLQRGSRPFLRLAKRYRLETCCLEKAKSARIIESDSCNDWMGIVIHVSVKHKQIYFWSYVQSKKSRGEISRHTLLSHFVWRVVPDDVDLTNQNRAADYHRHRNDGDVLACKV